MSNLVFILIVLLTGIGIGILLGLSQVVRNAVTGIRGARLPVIGMLLIGLGCAALVAALIASLYTWRFTRLALRTAGTVIAMRERTDRDSASVTYAPTFQFRDASGLQHTVAATLYSSPPEFHVGDPVTVLYRRDQPQKARIDSFWQVWAIPALLGIIGGVQLPIGLAVLLWPGWARRLRGPAAPDRPA